MTSTDTASTIAVPTRRGFAASGVDSDGDGAVSVEGVGGRRVDAEGAPAVFAG